MLLFLEDLINIEKFRISFRFFYSSSFILRSRATSQGLNPDEPDVRTNTKTMLSVEEEEEHVLL